jgi:FtsP/CotA-like multicopper oxidase with cupredoxin domain
MFKKINRRNFLKYGTNAALGLTGTAALAKMGLSTSTESAKLKSQEDQNNHTIHAGQLGTVGDVTANSFDPTKFLTDFDYGQVSKLPNGQTLREYKFVAVDKEIEIAPGIFFPGWTYNGQVPGPTIRCSQGDRIRIYFSNAGSHPHTIHFHGIHPGVMDGVFEIVEPGQDFTYQFDAEPYGLHLYHCHTMPLKRHIHKGLYGAFIVDPKGGRPKVDHEYVMVMNGFDTNFDNDNEVYAVNTVAFHYKNHPIKFKVNEKVRVYLVNITEFDPVNSFHLHAQFFQVYRTGTSLTPHDYTDTIMMCQAERHILEFSYTFPGRYMFHAHQSEFAELGWMGLFEVEDQHAV